ncbi:MAG: glycine zipper domain-containing protein [Thermodesulfobacteriota bacterium]
MRTWIVIVMLIAALATGLPAAAGDRATGGLLLGAGSGALIGQAIGRDTEATLLGTAVGGVLGYIVGNEAEKDYRSGPTHAYRYDEPVYYEGERGRGECGPCREAEILGTVDGEARTIVATVCRDRYGRWLVRDDRPVMVRSRPVVYREPVPVVYRYREPVPVFNIGLGWFGGHSDHRRGHAPRWSHHERWREHDGYRDGHGHRRDDHRRERGRHR